MNLVGFISTAVLSLTLVAAAPVYAQEQHGQDEQKAKPEEKKAQPEKSAKQDQKPAAQQEKNTRPEENNAQQRDKNTKQEEKSAQQQDKNAKQEEKSAQQQNKNTRQEQKSAQQEQQHTQQARPEQQAQRASGNRGGRIPDDRFKANFGEQHRFRVSDADYDNHRFQYGGYWFGFVDPWPSNWLYTQDVFVVEIDGVYYLCNAMYPGINIALTFNP